MTPRLRLYALMTAAVALPVLAAPATRDFASMDLDELMAINVTSVSRKLENLFTASAAIHVISGDEVLQMGAQDVPSALRLAPGIQVGRIDAFNYAVSPRGFNDVSANKTLALVDGRTIYTPFFGGVQWSQQELLLEDLDRIEIIRGPGATLWGANAVNGVINLTTKSAAETQGSLLRGSIGDGNTRYTAVARQGFVVGDGHARVYAQHAEREQALEASGTSTGEPWRSTLAGFRYDRGTKATGALTVTAEHRETKTTSAAMAYSLVPPYISPYLEPSRHQASHILARYERDLTPDTALLLRTYGEHFKQDRMILSEERDIWDLEAEVHHTFNERHDIVTGTSVRFHGDEIESGSGYTVKEPTSNNWLFTAFAQDEIRLVPDTLTVTIGTKLEHNDFTGWEVQPGVRGTWTPHKNVALWASLARAVRTPARAERGTRIYAQVIPPSVYNPLPTQVTIDGSDNFGHEELLAWEAGVRLHPSQHLTFDIAGFVNDYDGIRSIEPGPTSLVYTPVPHILVANASGNGIRGQAYGAEISARWNPHPRVHFQATGNLHYYNLENAPGSRDTAVLTGLPGSTPRFQVGLFSQFEITSAWRVDTFIQRVDALRGVGVPAYTALDVHLTWKMRTDLEISAVGRDLLDPQHPEFPPTFLGGATREIARSYFLQITWRK